MMSEPGPAAEKVESSTSSHTPADTLNAHAATASQMASDAKATVLNATATATDAVAKEHQATMNDIHGLSASAKGAVNKPDAHPLAKYHSFLYDTVTWKFPRASAIAAFLIISTILASQFVNFSRFIFRILWFSFAATATVESISKLVMGRGLVSNLKPRGYYQVSKPRLDAVFEELANVLNFMVLELQRLLYAENTSHTAVAFIISFVAYKLLRYIPLWSLALVGTIMAFSVPPLYLRNQDLIDKHIAQAQSIAAEKATMAKNLAGEKVGFVGERAKSVTSEWGKKAGVELPWSPPKQSPSKPAKASGVDVLQGLNVPQETPRKVDPAKVSLPESPARVAL